MSGATSIRVLVADDHLVMRLGLEALINAEDGMHVVAEAASGPQAVALFRIHRPDVTLMDLRLPGLDGISAIRAICGEAPEARIIVLTVDRGDEAVYQALAAGARGYLLKDMPSEDILGALRTVHQGGRYLPPEVGAQIVARFRHEALTPREVQVVRLMAKGLSNREIGRCLGTSAGTARNHVASVLDKLRVNDRTHAVTLALERSIISLEELDLREPSRPPADPVE